MMEETARIPARSARQVLYTLFRNKHLIVGAFLAVFVITALATLTAPKVYEAEAKMEVGVGREAVGLDPTLMDERRLTVYQTREYEINREVSELTSRARMGEAVDILSPEFILGRTTRLGTAATSYLGFSEGPAAPGEEEAVRLPVPGGTAAEGQAAPQSAGKAAPSQGLLRALLGRIRPGTPLSLREQALLRLKSSFSASSAYNSAVISLAYRDSTPQRAHLILKALLAIHLQGRSQRPGNANSYSFFSEQTTRLARELDRTEQELKALRARYGVVSITDQKNVLLQRLSTLKASRDETQAEIAALRAQLPLMERDLDPQLQLEQSRLQSLLARHQALDPQVRQLEAEANQLNGVEFQIRELERSADIQDKNLRKYQENLELARINSALENEQITNLTILQDALPPEVPVSPQTKRNLLLGALLGLLAGLGLAFTRETFDHTLKTPREVEALGIAPNIASVPLVTARAPARGDGSEAHGVLSWFETMPEVREAFLYLKDDLLASMPPGQAPYILAVTSCRRGEGVTTVAAGLAWALAGFEQLKVLLVDASLNHPGEKRFNGISLPGLKELSLEQVRRHAAPQEAARETPTGEDGRLTPFAHPLQFPGLLPAVKGYGSGIVVLDLPPVQESSAVLKVASQADGILLVVQAEKVHQEVAARIRDRSEKMGGRLIGLVLNKRRYYIPRLLYR